MGRLQVQVLGQGRLQGGDFEEGGLCCSVCFLGEEKRGVSDFVWWWGMGLGGGGRNGGKGGCLPDLVEGIFVVPEHILVLLREELQLLRTQLALDIPPFLLP